MFGLGWSETLLIAIVALIVVGPKDLPGLFRQMGQFVGKARGMAREFSKAMEAAADEAGVKEVEKTLRAAANPKSFGMDKLKEATSFGPETRKLSEEREASKKAYGETSARLAKERQAREQAAAEEAARAEAEAWDIAAEEEDDLADAAFDLPPAEPVPPKKAPVRKAAAKPADAPAAPKPRKAAAKKTAPVEDPS